MIIIEQDEEQVKHAVELHRNAAIDGFRLVRAELTSNTDLGAIKGELEAVFAFNSSGARRKDDQLLLETEFECKVVSHGNENETSIINLRCLFESRYDLRPNFSPSEEQINAFQSANGVFNCWPFFREFLQSMVTRAGLPPPPVPFLRLQPKKTQSSRPDHAGQTKPKTQMPRPKAAPKRASGVRRSAPKKS